MTTALCDPAVTNQPLRTAINQRFEDIYRSVVTDRAAEANPRLVRISLQEAKGMASNLDKRLYQFIDTIVIKQKYLDQFFVKSPDVIDKNVEKYVGKLPHSRFSWIVALFIVKNKGNKTYVLSGELMARLMGFNKHTTNFVVSLRSTLQELIIESMRARDWFVEATRDVYYLKKTINLYDMSFMVEGHGEFYYVHSRLYFIFCLEINEL